MERVTGIGGIFFKARDPQALAAWYERPRREPLRAVGAPGLREKGEMTLRQAWKRIREMVRGPKPQMSGREIRRIRRSLRPTDVMLEWGCGGSTYRFSRRVRAYHSIEHDPAWYEKIRRILDRAGRSNVRLLLVPPTLPEEGVPNYARPARERYAQFRDYVDAVEHLGVRRFDRVLIDGRSRPECAIRVLPYLDRESLVFIHDFYNTRYDPAEYERLLDHYEVVDSIRSGRSLVVLRPRPE